MMIIDVKLENYGGIKKLIQSYDFTTTTGGKRWGGMKSYLVRSAKKSWKSAVIRVWQKAGKPTPKRLINVTSRSPSKYTFVLEVPEHAKYFWYGTKRSRGRYIPRLDKRFSKKNLDRNIKLYGEKFVGWHPGISIKKFPLRKTFWGFFLRKYRLVVSQWLRRKVK